jgi:hypothetical protein
MVAKTKKGSRTSRQPRKMTAAKSSVKDKQAKQELEPESAASDRFVKDLLVRGEAAKTDQQGNLELTATHVITKEEKDGTAKVKRARFKYF